jgi:outer membrane lipoprotein SlyB
MKLRTIALVTAAATALSGCVSTPMGPNIPSSPGAGKSFEAYQQDETACEDYAHQHVAGQAEAANNTAVGTALIGTALGAGLGAAVGGGRGAAIGAGSGAVVGSAVGADESGGAQMTIQRRYDIAFAACMRGHGENAGMRPRPYGPPPPPPGYYPPPPPPGY